MSYVLQRFTRPTLAAVLVAAQVVSMVGFPVVRSARVAAGCPGGACGCGACGRTEGCCCRSLAPPKVEPEPACPRCRPDKPSGCCPRSPAADPGSEPGVRWVAGFQARQCRGDGPLGVQAESPAVPPGSSPSPVTAPAPSGVVPAADVVGPSRVTVPPDPPPEPV